MKGPVTLKMAGPEVFQTLIGEEFVSKMFMIYGLIHW